MRKRQFMLLLVLLGSIIILTACKNNNTDTEVTEANDFESAETSSTEAFTKNHVEMDIDIGPEGTFYTVPMYFQHEYSKTVLGGINVAKNGNLITCLSMLDSFYASEYITPDLFLEKYADYITENGEYNAEELISAVAENNYRKMYIRKLEAENLTDYVLDMGYAVLVHINHSSMYGQSSSYIIITGITDEGQLYVRDPNEENVKEYGIVLDNGEVVYRSFDFMMAAGNDATLYVLGGGLSE